MANGWTQERKKRQSLLIHTWNPSGRSTGSRTIMGKARSSLNALKHGGRSKPAQETCMLLEKMLHWQSELTMDMAHKNGENIIT